MPRQPTATETRLEYIIACITPALAILKELNDALEPAFIQPISNTIEALANMAQSETVGSLAPVMLDNIGKFMETLHKIHTFLEAKQDGNKIRNLFHNSEMQNPLKDCHAGLNQAMEVFGINTTSAMVNNFGDIKTAAKIMHEELLEVIQTLPDTSASSDGSSPKIFHGREMELNNIMKILSQQSPRIAILGGGGMGKTDTFFVSAEAATTSVELAALVGLHAGLSPGKDLTKAVVQYFHRKPLSLLILDNLETVWEPIQSRGQIEEFLSLLTDIEHLALIITMRGTERPAKVQWTHPFLLPLQPLSDEATQQTFIYITDNAYAKEDIHQILQFTDNMPLAVDLIAHLSDYEATRSLGEAHRWPQRLPRCQSSRQLHVPRHVLRLPELAYVFNVEALARPLETVSSTRGRNAVNILSCKTILLATSLAYQDSNKRLWSLVPVREHIRKFLPPSPSVYSGEQLQPVINQITLNLGNLQEILQEGVTGCEYTGLMQHIQPILSGLCEPELEIYFAIEIWESWESDLALDPEQLLNQTVTLLEHVRNPFLKAKFYCAAGFYFFNSRFDSPQALLFFHKALESAKQCGDTKEQCSISIGIAQLKYRVGDYCTAQVHATEAQRLSKLSANLFEEARSLWIGSMTYMATGNFKKSMEQLNRAQEIAVLCGLSRGDLGYNLTMSQAEIHLQKSEHAQARKI
ncbi:hypothetical protein DFH08DRAFT_803809 [Mycena albidolilacea]|uniref:NB-ARC domain-containing protein n=1 Tax=Mycena albidolilacea TaxID=1033008 RepID=A0AAD7EXW1_9AGAR|nr:hypothetical protein DFH08DRAFT_803809 [Mycena albidolilacea]